MPYSISTLLIRNLRDVFGENDPARRRAAIDEIYTEDCVFYDPRPSRPNTLRNGRPSKMRWQISAFSGGIISDCL